MSSKFRQTKSSFNKMSGNNTTFYRTNTFHVQAEPEIEIEPDIKTSDDNNRKLTRKEYNRPDVIVAKQTELEKFFKFNVIKSVPHTPLGAEVMRTTWVFTEKADNLSKTGSKIKARLRTMGNSST